MADWISMSIKIEDMPDGYFKERLLELAATPATEVIVVAKHGSIGDWAAYIGWPMEVKPEAVSLDTGYYLTRLRDPQGVLEVGDKLPRDEAVAIFPDATEWPPDRYRP